MNAPRLPADAVYHLVDRHENLKTRRFELLPLRGDGAAFTDVQGRGWGSDPTTSPAELADLISSIGAVGQLQPILVEELPDAGGRRVVSGERRLLALRWGSINQTRKPALRFCRRGFGRRATHRGRKAVLPTRREPSSNPASWPRH